MRNTTECTVEQASAILGVTPRSVINYIKAKEINALKVGKSWYVNAASLEAFKQRFGFRENITPQVTHASPEKVTETANAQIETFRKPPDPEDTPAKKREIYPVHRLRLFQIAQEVLHGVSAKTAFPADRPDLQQKFFSLKAEALELLGAGFYAFSGKSKAILYNRSREKVGGILSLCYFYHKSTDDIPAEILKIEEELLPAYSSLIRKIEKKYERT
jgi:excisionase family DNA binding protein